MGSMFEAVGFSIKDDDAYNQLAIKVSELGSRRTIYRRGAKLHGCCYKIGQGLEVWTVLYESDRGLVYADCRPAFRPGHIYTLNPWELTEYDEDGEAVVRGYIDGKELVFELQNLTELDTALFHRPYLRVGFAGLGYSAQICKRPMPSRFLPTSKLIKWRGSCENDYTIRGKVLALRNIKNPITNSELVWVYIDTGAVKLEAVFNTSKVRGELRTGATISGKVWLQGYILGDSDVEARYEGVDRSFQIADFWTHLRRDN